VSDADVDLFQPLLECCEDFFQRCFGRPAREDEARRMPLERPPGLGPERRHLVALRDSGRRLVGVLEGVSDFPAPGEWYLGLMLLAPEVRGKGRGEAVLRGYEDWLRREGARLLRLGVSEPNPDAHRFWTRVGFHDEPLREARVRHRRPEELLVPGGRPVPTRSGAPGA
jgi:GNAT superfamily N-acetyltransferase